MNRPALRDSLISVVLPVFNEANVLEELCQRVSRAVSECGTRQEIIFVNDGSTDASAETLDQLAARFPQVRVVHLSRNFGHQAAVQAGLAHARGDAVVLMDSDLQDAPEAIGRLVAEWVCGFDVVYALRRERPEAWWKRCLFSGFHRLLARVAATSIPEDAGNFSLIDARVVREIVSLGERDRYLPGLRSWVGFKQRGIEVRRNPRYDGKPRVSVRGLWRLAKTAIFSFSSFPLTTFYAIGYTALGLFFALGAYALFCKLFTAVVVPGWTSNMLTASFFGAVNALGISILGEYVIRIYDQVRGRPLYLIERTQNVLPAQSTTAQQATAHQVTATQSEVFQMPAVTADADDAAYADLLAEAEALLDAATPAPVARLAVAVPAEQPQEAQAVRSTERRKSVAARRSAASSPAKAAGNRRKSGSGKSKQRRGE